MPGSSGVSPNPFQEYAMSAPRIRGALFTVSAAVLAFASACSNGTEPKQALCDASNTVTLTPGQVQTPITAPCVYISSTDAGEYALVPFNSDTTYKNTASITFTSQGAAVATSLLELSPFATAPLANVVLGEASSAPTPSYAYDIALRQSERRVLAPLMSSARSWYTRRGASSPSTGLRPSFSVTAATWSVGDYVALNTRSGATLADACQTPDNRTGRVVAISQHAIVVADTNNPAGGYTDAEYATIAVQFDSVYTMDVNAFGTPSDIDSNGHIIMFFTRAVNELTPPASSSVVGGFFYARDLFPKQDSPQLGTGSGCPTSNVSEMFYLAVADPNNLVNGNKSFTKDFVSHLTVSTTAHEFQHLINASRRLYVNTSASDFEVVWLNEGLSHIAEELLFYQQSNGLTPRMDVDSVKVRLSQQNVNAYNFDQQGNFGRFRAYIVRPATSSPYAPDDSLWTRGATWSFLRYAADHRGTSDADTWFKLDNSTTTGLDNLQQVFGSGLMSMFRDWAVAHIADDVPNVPNEWQHLSWNFKSIFHLIGNHQPTPNPNGYPLASTPLSDASPVTVTLNGGGAAYVRFSLSAGQTSSIKWDTQSSKVAMSLVRMK
jgi:hypothetical protein